MREMETESDVTQKADSFTKFTLMIFKRPAESHLVVVVLFCAVAAIAAEPQSSGL